MYVGTISARSKITLPGGFPISIESIVGMLCRRLWNRTDCNCDALNEYTARELRTKITDFLTEMILDAVPGVNCNSPDLVNILINSINISGGGSGLSVSLNFDPALRAAASVVLCNLAKNAMNMSNTIDPLVGVVVTFIQETACPNSSRNVTVNNEYGFAEEPQPTQPTLPLEPAPSAAQQQQQQQQQTYTSTWSPTMFQKRKSSAVPILIAGGVALAASAVILSRRR